MKVGFRLALRWSNLRITIQILRAGQQGANQTFDIVVVRFFGVPEVLVEGAFVAVIAHFAPEVEDKVRLKERSDETLLILGLERERLQAVSFERIGGN